jgi:hypothetical protein
MEQPRAELGYRHHPTECADRANQHAAGGGELLRRRPPWIQRRRRLDCPATPCRFHEEGAPPHQVAREGNAGLDHDGSVSEEREQVQTAGSQSQHPLAHRQCANLPPTSGGADAHTGRYFFGGAEDYLGAIDLARHRIERQDALAVPALATPRERYLQSTERRRCRKLARHGRSGQLEIATPAEGTRTARQDRVSLLRGTLGTSLGDHLAVAGRMAIEYVHHVL